MDQLTTWEGAAIVILHKIGWLQRDIAHRLHCSPQTVSMWVRRWEECHSLHDKERSGRPRCADETTDVSIEDYAEEKRFTTPREIKNELELDCSSRTIRRRLDEVDLHGRVLKEEHAFTHEHIRNRIAFADGYSRWTEDDWSRVMFSDETHFYLGQHGQEYAQRPVGEALDPKYTLKTDRLQGKVSLWGCIKAFRLFLVVALSIYLLNRCGRQSTTAASSAARTLDATSQQLRHCGLLARTSVLLYCHLKLLPFGDLLLVVTRFNACSHQECLHLRPPSRVVCAAMAARTSEQWHTLR